MQQLPKPSGPQAHMPSEPQAPRHSSPHPPDELTHMTPYLWALMCMLVSATIFDAFNVAILSTVAPIIQQIYGLSHTQWGLVNLIVRVGAVMSFFVLILADHV